MFSYLRIIRMSIQNSLQFRGYYLMSLFNTIGLVPVLLFWQIILKNGDIGSYNSNLMLTYATTSSVLQFFLSTSVGGDICSEIRQGSLSSYLVEPISHLLRHFCIFIGKLLGESLPKAVVQVIVVIVIVKVIGFNIQLQLSSIGILILFVIEGILISFLVNLEFGLIGFWLTEISTFFMLIEAITSVLAGGALPLDLLPWGLGKILIHTPFSFMLYYPIKAGMGQIDYPLQVLCEGLFWVSFLSVLAIITWKQGLRKYSAPGG